MNDVDVAVSVPDSLSIRGISYAEAEQVAAVRSADIRELFGVQARLSEEIAFSGPGKNVKGLSVEAALFGSGVVLTLFYCFLLRRYGYILPMLFRSVFYKKSAMKLNDSLDVNISDMLTLGTLLFICSTTVFIFTAVLHATGLPAELSGAVRFLPVILFALLAVCVYRILFRKTVVFLTGSGGLFRELKFYNRVGFTFWAILITPVVLLCCFVEQTLFRHTVYVVASGYAILLVQRIVELWQLFHREKVSFLQYILYFCTIEFLPVSFLAVYTYRKLLL